MNSPSKTAKRFPFNQPPSPGTASLPACTLTRSVILFRAFSINKFPPNCSFGLTASRQSLCGGAGLKPVSPLWGLCNCLLDWGLQSVPHHDSDRILRCLCRSVIRMTLTDKLLFCLCGTLICTSPVLGADE